MLEQTTSAKLDCLNGRSAELEFPLTTWNQAFQLKLKTRLMHSTNQGSSSTLTTLKAERRSPIRTQESRLMETIKSRFHKTIAHSPAQEVIVKDV